MAFDGHDQEIYTIKVGGGGKVQVTNNNTDDYHPSYSPDGKKIVYEGWVWDRNRNYVVQTDIYTIKATGGKPFNLTNSGGFDEGGPTYSPNGKKIAYSRGVVGNGLGKPNSYEIYTINATGGTPFQLTHNKMGDWEPSYSPDGKKIAYARGAEKPTTTSTQSTLVGEVGYKSPTTVRTTSGLPGEAVRSGSSRCPQGMK